ncbi:MAG TPA: 4Fe-4S binding protein, partial [Candidatus Syntrophosphaera thermopropionivorans]|nr:4Fe-4S binding protein [Candidatus Syntrophosphaera thermopropionivorans]
MIEVIDQKCVGCGLCMRACAYGAIRIEAKLAVIDEDKCTLCGACVEACPFDAIIIRKQAAEQIDKEQYKGIWVFAEQRDQVIAPVVFELLGKGKELAEQMNSTLTAVLLGSNLDNLYQELFAYGADQVIAVDDPALEHFLDLHYARALTELARKHKPAIILAGATVTGRSFIPRV